MLLKPQDQLSLWNPKARCLVVRPRFLSAAKKVRIKEMDLKGSETQITKRSNRTRQLKEHTNQCNPSLSSILTIDRLTTKVWPAPSHVV